MSARGVVALSADTPTLPLPQGLTQWHIEGIMHSPPKRKQEKEKQTLLRDREGCGKKETIIARILRARRLDCPHLLAGKIFQDTI